MPQSQARSSLQARKNVCEYLNDEGFAQDLRFAGHCDYFSVGGRYSGRLNLLRLRQESPKQFARFWKRYWMKDIGAEEAERLFREMFPKYQGKLPINRGSVGFDGAPDDGQIMDEALFQQLKGGFSNVVDYSYEIAEPNVICTEDTDASSGRQTARKPPVCGWSSLTIIFEGWNFADDWAWRLPMIEMQIANGSETTISPDDKQQTVLPEREFLTVKQTAEFLNISASIIYKMCITKKLAHYRFGEGAGAIRINRADLMEFIKRCHVEERKGGVRFVAPEKTTPYVYQCLDLRPMHACGAMTKAGTPCTHRTREERCHLHQTKTGTTP